MSSKVSVSHYINSGMYTPPVLIDSNQPNIGLSNSQVVTIQQQPRSNISCSFRRDNSNSAAGYIQVNDISELFMIVAFGSGNFLNFSIKRRAF